MWMWSRRCEGAHPHSRGENLAEQGWDVPALGSSPLTRGKHWRGMRRPYQLGLTPTRAGKTLHDPAHRSASTAHPRSRRENFQSCVMSLPTPGSSPLTRGKRSGLGGGADRAGIIPAPAGKTSSARSWPASRPAHPRSRGENVCELVDGLVELGSSPLTRGKLRRRMGNPVRLGLIPAHAGKTLSSRPLRFLARAHPRSRGENVDQFAATPVKMGSSPLAQGKPPGNGRRNRRGRAHPHSRRENVA